MMTRTPPRAPVARITDPRPDRAAAVMVVLDGPPVAKARARVYMQPGGHIRAVTPVATRDYQARLRAAGAAAMSPRPAFRGPVEITVGIFLAPPPSWPKAKAQAALRGEVVPACRPDIDNFIKVVLDALVGPVLADDGQVIEIYTRKRYSPGAALVVTVTPLLACRPGEFRP